MYSPPPTLLGVVLALVLSVPYIVFSVGARRYRNDVAHRCALRAAGTPPEPPPLPTRRPVEQMSRLRQRLIRNADAAFARSADRYEAEKVRARRGFSMIELAVVLVVVGVIAAISMPTFQSTIQRASEKAELIEVTSAMRNAVALAAINERLDPTGDDLDLAFSELDPDAVVLAASAEPEPDAWRYSANASGVTVVGASTARSGECVAGTASNRSVSARHLTATGGDPAASLCVAVLDADGEMEFGVDGPPVPVVPGSGGSELSGLVAPDGTDCSLVMPTPLYGGDFAPPGDWVAGGTSGCVPVTFTAFMGGIGGQIMSCPVFSTGTGAWVQGNTSGEPPSVMGSQRADFVAEADVIAGAGCVPTGAPVSEPYSPCPLPGGGQPPQLLTYSEWLAGERCAPVAPTTTVPGGGEDLPEPD